MAGKRDTVKDKDRYSIVCPDLTKCWVCGTSSNIHLHEIFGGSNRSKSKTYGMVVPLCGKDHNLSIEGVHFNKALDTRLKIEGQKAWEKNYIKTNAASKEEARKAFLEAFHENYIFEEDEVTPKRRSYVF